MKLLDAIWTVLDPFAMPKTITGTLFGGSDNPYNVIGYNPDAATQPGTDSAENVINTRKQLILAGALLGAIVAAPAIYSQYSKKKLKEKEVRTGIALENSSVMATNLLTTAIASPAIATATAYILVQKLEDAHIITRGLGNATQALLTVAAAGPMVQGIAGLATSAFAKKGK